MGWSIGRLKQDSLVDVIRACKDANVLRLTIGDMTIIFGDPIPRIDSTQIEQAYVPGVDKVDFNESTKREVTPEQVEAVREDVLSRLLVEDPEAFEKLQTGDKE